MTINRITIAFLFFGLGVTMPEVDLELRRWIGWGVMGLGWILMFVILFKWQKKYKEFEKTLA